MSANDILERLRESLREVVLCMDAAAEIERLRVADGMLRHGIRQLELDLSVKITEAERLHTEIGRRIQDKRESDGRVMAAMEIDERQRAEIERLRAVEKDHESMLSYMREILPEAEPDDDIHKIGERLSAQIGKHEAGAKSLTRIQDKARDLARELGFYRVQRSDESGLEYEAALMAEGKVLVERLRASEARAVAERERVCTWAKEHDEGPYWTECKHAFECITDGPKENGFKHCCFCGGKIEVKEASDESKR